MMIAAPDVTRLTPTSPVKFDREGEFKYHCKIHGETMSGTIVVKPAAAN